MTTAMQKSRVLLESDEIARVIARLAHQILEPDDAQRGVVLIGVRRGGEALAHRLASEIERISGKAPALGFLNINLYRDDRVTHEMPESQIPVDISDRLVIIADDVLFTGRTIRAALDAVTDLGRPAAMTAGHGLRCRSEASGTGLVRHAPIVDQLSCAGAGPLIRFRYRM